LPTRATGLFLLALIGQAAAVQLIDVRPYAVFQHYEPWRSLPFNHPMATSVVVVQAVIIGVLAFRSRVELLRFAVGLLSARQLIAVFALCAFSLAVPAVSLPFFVEEVVLAGALAALAALSLVLMALTLSDSWLVRAQGWLDARITLGPGQTNPRPWDGKVPSVVAIWVMLVSTIAGIAVFERMPHIDDSISNYFQAKYFAAGHLFLPAPPDAQSFQVDQTIVERTKWYGYAFPAWPLVLAVGVRLGLPWLVNPILGGLLIVLGHLLVRRRFDSGTANTSVLILAASPWLIFMSAEFMPHPLTAVLVIAAALAFDYASERTKWWPLWAVTAGLAVGTLGLTRAIDAAIVVVALAVSLLADRRFGRTLPAGALAGLVAAILAASGLAYNLAVTGNATYPPHMAWSDGRWGPGIDRLGFGPDVGIRAWPNLDPLPGHGPADVVLNANKNLFMANQDLLGWAPGSLLFVWLAIVLGRTQRRDSLMLALISTYVIGYSAYWFSGGPDLGPRYWYPAIIPMAALTAFGAQMLIAALRRQNAASQPAARTAAFIVAATMCAGIVMVPWRAATKYYRYRGVGGEVRALAESRRFEHALVFVRSDRRDYQSAFNLNPNTLHDSATIYAYDAGAAHRAAVVAHFPDRTVWVIGRSGSDPTRAPLDVIEGPLAPGTVP
jgi:hypothetical protein